MGPTIFLGPVRVQRMLRVVILGQLGFPGWDLRSKRVVVSKWEEWRVGLVGGQ